MAKFRVKAGLHRDLAGNTYKAGQVVESEDDLDKKFRGKFERLESSRTGKKKKRRGEKAASKKKRKNRSRKEKASSKRSASMGDERKGDDAEE